MPLIPRLLLVAGVGSLLADTPSALRVLRADPTGAAAPTASITVTFDRPVAGSLDRTVDPASVLVISPAIAGTAEWRDPVTIRFRPARSLPSNLAYKVTVRESFAAMDGSRLAAPYSFTFRVRGPRVLTGSVARGRGMTRFLAPDSPFELVTDGPVDSGQLTSVYLEFARTCATPGVVRLRAQGQRPLNRTDPSDYQEAGGWDRDRSADSLRRVIRLLPERPLPRGCAGELVYPATFDATGRAALKRWSIGTYGDFRLDKPDCGWGSACPSGPIIVRFSTPVKGSEVLRRISLAPAATFTVGDSTDVRAEWALNTSLRPRTTYAVIADTAIRDAFGQRLVGNTAVGVRTTGFSPSVTYTFGRATVERKGLRTLGVTYVNVDTLDVTIAPVPDSLVPTFMAREWGWSDRWNSLAPGATRQRIALRGERDVPRVYGIRLPAPDARRRDPTLLAVRVSSQRLDSASRNSSPIALVQVTDLGVHAKIGVEEGVVWVTGASDGRPRAGADVVLFDPKGRSVASARTDTAGLARLRDFRRYAVAAADTASDDAEGDSGFDGYVAVTLGDDRALLGIHEYDADLSPWQFNVSPSSGAERLPAAGALFTERGIYRPGEPLYAKVIMRSGTLGRLSVPAERDSVRWEFAGRDEDAALRDTVVALSPFGTADQRITLPADAKLGAYRVSASLRRKGRWVEIASAGYRIAEYRPPEFLVDVQAPATVRFSGDSLDATVEARYLFGAPMGRAAVSWTVLRTPVGPWELDIPNTDGFQVGESGFWWEEMADERAGPRAVVSGTDTLDQAGHLALRVPLGETEKGRAARATVRATVTDVNRQTVTASASVTMHPASFYLGAKVEGTGWFWKAGTPVTVRVIAVRPDGVRVPGVRVGGVVERREWHQVRREREGFSELVGEWVTDTVARCSLVTTGEPAACRFTPPEGGSYNVRFTASDERRRPVAASFYRWAMGTGWVPWNDETQFRMDVIPDRTRYSVGDTATVMFASPFTGAEAWVTVEREGLIEQRRLTITSGTATLRFPITEAYAPNAYVSIVVARGRSAAPGPLDDPGRPTIRVGYAELRVTPERKRLTVDLSAARDEYRPGDTTRVSVRVRDAGGQGQRSEVTLWAVDEGVLSLTGYRTPDPIDLLYQPRGIGLRLASTLSSVAPQVPEGEKGRRAPGGGGGEAGGDVLRSRFQTTAFFLGSVLTDADGRAIASARLPDNLTTFRVMAVAVTAGDRYGSGHSALLVTRPLVARPALPRFLREGDRFSAGVVVNSRLGGTPTVNVTATPSGADLRGSRRQTATLEAGRGREVRFDFTQPVQRGGLRRDSTAFRFDAASGRESDAVRIAVPIRPAFHTRSYTIAGRLADTASARFALPAGIDPERSRLAIGFGTSPLLMIRGAWEQLRVYPYYCTEQVVSAAQPLIALYRARAMLGADSGSFARARPDIVRAVEMLSRRQRADGGIGYWSPTDWTTPWLSAYAGAILVDAKAAGVPVSDSVLARLGRYLQSSLAARRPGGLGPIAAWYASDSLLLADRVAALEYLGRVGIRNRAVENELVRRAPQLAWEDRILLASVLARWNDPAGARRLLEPAWAATKVEGRTAVLPTASTRNFYFYSPIRPAAYLLSATLAVEPDHPLVGPLVELLIQQGRTGRWTWNTQDYGTAVRALTDFQARQRAATERTVRVRDVKGRVLLEAGGGATRDSSVALSGLLETARDGAVTLPLRLEAPAPGSAIYYYLTVTEVPRAQPVRPDYAGITVERWYEDYTTGKPIIATTEGSLVRVRLRISVDAERHFVVLDDALPAGLEAVDLSLRTVGAPGPGRPESTGVEEDGDESEDQNRWAYGSWDGGWWTPFDHRELRDDRVVYAATILWPGRYTASYLVRATTPGVFVRPPAQAEEMYNPAVYGRTDGGVFTVEARAH